MLIVEVTPGSLWIDSESYKVVVVIECDSNSESVLVRDDFDPNGPVSSMLRSRLGAPNPSR